MINLFEDLRSTLVNKNVLDSDRLKGRWGYCDTESLLNQ